VARGLSGQRGCALEEGGGGGQAAARLCPTGGPLELGGDVLVRAGSRLGQMPSTSVGIELRVGRLGQRPVNPSALVRRRGPVDRGACERMAKPNPAVDLEQARGLRRVEHRVSDAQSRGRAPQQSRVAGRLRRGHQQQLLRVRRQRLEPIDEALLDFARERQRSRQPEPARQLRRRQSPRQLQQRERVAMCLHQQLLCHPLVQPPRYRRRQQRSRIRVPKTLHHELRKPTEFSVCLTRGNKKDDRLRQQPARHERQHFCRGPVQPLCIVDRADQRALLHRLREQAQGRQANQEPIRDRTLT
jgi:hypothetical protein